MKNKTKALTMRVAAGRAQLVSWVMVAFAAAALAGCNGRAPVEAGQTKKDETYTAKLQQVLVVRSFYLPAMPEMNLNGFIQLNEIKAAFDAKVATPFGVHADYVDVTKYNKVVSNIGSEPAVLDAIATVHPTQILAFQAASANTTGSLQKYTVNVLLYDTARNKLVWRSLISVDNMAGRIIRIGDRLAPSHQDEADLFIDALRSQLQSAGLL